MPTFTVLVQRLVTEAADITVDAATAAEAAQRALDMANSVETLDWFESDLAATDPEVVTIFCDGRDVTEPA